MAAEENENAYVEIRGKRRRVEITAIAIIRVEEMLGPHAIAGGKFGLSTILALLAFGLQKDDPKMRYDRIVKWYDGLAPAERKEKTVEITKAVTKAYLAYHGEEFDEDEIEESAAEFATEHAGGNGRSAEPDDNFG